MDGYVIEHDPGQIDPGMVAEEVFCAPCAIDWQPATPYAGSPTPCAECGTTVNGS